MRWALFLALATIPLSSCGLQPLYSGGSAGPVAHALATIDVAPIEGNAGWLVANGVRDRLSESGHATPRYRLDIKLDDQIDGLAVSRNDTVTRERRTLRARFQLVDLTKGTVLLDSTAGSDAGIDVVGSEYATIAAENSALENLSDTIADKIVTRVALYARHLDGGQ